MTLDQWLFLAAIAWIVAVCVVLVHRAEARPDGVAARLWDALDRGLFGGQP